MPDEAVSLQDINWRETFPFTHLFRAFRVAVHPSKLILALVALGCLWCGGLILDAIWGRNHQVTTTEWIELAATVPHASALPAINPLAADQAGMELAPASEVTPHFGVFRTFFDYEVSRANDVLMFRGGFYTETENVWNFIAVGPLWLWSHHWFFALLYTAWFLLIWSIFGGAITRIAAVHVARDEKISVRHALTFSSSKVLSFIFAPLIPVFIILAIGLAIAIASTILFHIPYVGPVVAGLSYCLALVGGFVITLVLLGAIGGFDLMYPTIAVEGSDSFDAISRSFSYVFARPWRMLLYTAVAIVYGAICYLFVRFFVWIILAVTWFFMTWLLGGTHLNQPAEVFPKIWPAPIDPLAPLPYTPAYDQLKSTEAISAGLIVWWNYILIGLVGAFAISFYFSVNTIIYFLMRREVDATELDDVYVEDSDDELEEPVPATVAGAPQAAVIRETATVRVYETEEGAAAPPPGAAAPVEPSQPPAEPPPGHGV